MNPLLKLEVEKRKRLVSKGVLPTTFTGVSVVYDKTGDKKREVPTFPHLFTPINQPFRYYQGLFGKFRYNNWSFSYDHMDASDINIEFIRLLPSAPLQTKESGKFAGIDSYELAKIKISEYRNNSYYCFFLHDNKIFYINKKDDLYKIKDELYSPQNGDLYELVMYTLQFEANGVSHYCYTADQIHKDGGIFAEAFYTRLTLATYEAALNSLLKKMEDNLYQLLIAHPYQLGSALLEGQAATFLYHLLGMFHAMISLVLDPLVELTAIITRTVCASKPDKIKDLFPTENDDTSSCLSM